MSKAISKNKNKNSSPVDKEELENEYNKLNRLQSQETKFKHIFGSKYGLVLMARYFGCGAGAARVSHEALLPYIKIEHKDILQWLVFEKAYYLPAESIKKIVFDDEIVDYFDPKNRSALSWIKERLTKVRQAYPELELDKKFVGIKPEWDKVDDYTYLEVAIELNMPALVKKSINDLKTLDMSKLDYKKPMHRDLIEFVITDLDVARTHALYTKKINPYYIDPASVPTVVVQDVDQEEDDN